LIPFIQEYQGKGIQYVICTDISKGQSEVEDSLKLKLIASGGISDYDELPRLAEIGCEGTIIGKAIYENRISLKQLENYILSV